VVGVSAWIGWILGILDKWRVWGGCSELEKALANKYWAERSRQLLGLLVAGEECHKTWDRTSKPSGRK
jgi:hypothetical protein